MINHKLPLALVTGATGLVGSHLIAALIQHGYPVRAMKRKTSNLSQFNYIMSYYKLDSETLSSQLEWVDADLLLLNSLLNAMHGVGHLYHCAAEVNLTSLSEAQLMKTNIEGTALMIRAAQASHVQKACFISSIAALGHTAIGEVIDEETPADSSYRRSAYGRSKLAVEELIFKADVSGLPSVIVNPGVVLGATNRNESSSKILFLAKRGTPFSTAGASGYVDVRNLCQAMIALMLSPLHGQRYIVVGANPTQHQLLALLNKGFGHRAPICLPNAIIKGAGALAGLINRTFGTNIPFDKQMAQTSINRTTYSSQKLVKAIAIQFTPLEETVSDICTAMSSRVKD